VERQAKQAALIVLRIKFDHAVAQVEEWCIKQFPFRCQDPDHPTLVDDKASAAEIGSCDKSNRGGELIGN